LPQDISDAARLDGANEWNVFRNIMLPLSIPGLSTLVVFQFINTWNQFLMPLVFVQRDELRPVALGTMFFFGRFTADRGMIAAGVTISMIPMVILYLLLQRRFIEGITAGAMKT
jgi:ABC-type glycerol-3-phosphate transport system permease component